MNHPIFQRAALAAAAIAVALGVAVSPASAATSVTSVRITPNAVRFDFEVDADSPRTSTIPLLTEPDRFCNNGLQPLVSPYTTVTLSVSESGDYLLSGSRTADLPGELASGANDVDGLGFGYLYPSDQFGTLDDSCVGSGGADFAKRSFRLEKGVTYTLVLLPFFYENGRYSMAVSGPGNVLADGASPVGLTSDQARAACAPGAAVPSGYTLREGTAKSETLTGTAGNDVIRGLGGNDTIRGLGGDDVLCGGEGQDTIDGGAGNDFVFGEASQDTLSGGIGDDHLDGGLGNDVLNGNDGADELVGADGQDTLYGQAGDDELFGGAGNDVLDGGAGSDVGTDTDPRSVFRNIESVNGPPTPGPTPTTTAAR